MLFFIIYTAVLAFVYGYVGWRVIGAARPGSWWKAYAWSVVVLFLALPPAAILFQVFQVPGAWRGPFDWMAYIGLGYFSLLFSFLVIRDAGWVAVRLIQTIRAVYPGRLDPEDPANPGRRGFLVQSMNLGLIGVTGALTGFGLYESRRSPDIVRVTAPIGNLPPAFDGFRILQISDLHVGVTIRRDYVLRVVERAGQIPADLIAFTGDLADGTVEELKSDVAPLAGLNAPLGQFFITGNHEYYSGAEPWIAEMRGLGYTVLLNEHRVLEKDGQRIVLAGVTDYQGGRFIKAHESSPKKAFRDAPPGLVRILLAHQPLSIFEAAEAGCDLMVSGHTHGGQYFPINYLARLAQPYVAGLHRHGDTLVYVSRGAGYWGPPQRIMAPSEITLITLKKA